MLYNILIVIIIVFIKSFKSYKDFEILTDNLTTHLYVHDSLMLICRQTNKIYFY